ncbi:MAG: radical SAM protein [gamma proteobacterium endosymbiont of Lamellibrachia anaximandri]|nr:radical SAM protein [gamma proteobacterium endosymbiont of Lamellibrachia anaximandri]MBL3617814.1 radical SAM protein [gamma proteobacterium endosymbiont of Lamellibrachia anaximandri]
MQEIFHFIMIKPTHYDDDGYPIQWLKSLIPSNSLACVYGLSQSCKDRHVLGEHVEIRLHAIDEYNSRVNTEALIAMIKRDGGMALVGMVGVQSNQFPRAIDLSLPFLAQDIPVCIGGFHVSGCFSMLDEMPKDMVDAQKLGISFFAGEAEGQRLDKLLIDAYKGAVKPIYNHLDDLPGLPDEPIPFLPREQVEHTYGTYSSFDLGRGCPFKCSFCTIINVQGRKSRFRSADDLERIIRKNHDIGVHSFFLTDDNFARNKNWEACLDRVIDLREQEGIEVRFSIQIDTLCHKIHGFVEKCCKAGVDQIFIGLENINAENLLAIKKRQNKISDYKEQILAWKQYPVVICAGYIVGFPGDTKESLLEDVETIKRELAIDHIYFTVLTPLPGCEDHQAMYQKGEWMDPDLNKYDLNHMVTKHPTLSDAEWKEAYEAVWNHFYTFEHMETIFKRMVAMRSNKKLTTLHRLLFYREFKRVFHVHPLEGGFLRLKYRKDRRPSFPVEPAVIFYPKFVKETLFTMGKAIPTYIRLRLMLKRIWTDPSRFEYVDQAITPISEDSSNQGIKS